MQYAGVQNTYSGNVPVTAAGQVELQILAMDPVNANFGLTHEDLTIVPYLLACHSVHAERSRPHTLRDSGLRSRRRACELQTTRLLLRIAKGASSFFRTT